eukprot:c6249_g1_i1.p1 GENE.c6249_g1_i1~~c6249_g1_i1.p1  ORF type:complete len:402 (+),score=69.64 c6249_g1_i1:38-1243(+)
MLEHLPLVHHTAHPATLTATSTFLCFYGLGCASWLLVTSIFAELSYMKNHVPENYSIYAILDLAIESGNAFPAIMVLFFPVFLAEYRAVLLLCVLVLAGAASAGIAFGWELQIGGSSVLLIFCAYLAGVAGSMSMITMFPFAASSSHNQLALSSLSAGVGSCGLISNLLALIQNLQNSDDTPRFQPIIYFLCITILLLLGLYSFLDMNLFSLKSIFRKLPVEHSETKSSLDRFTRITTRYPIPMFSIFLSCTTEFGVPALLPFLAVCGNSSETFWITMAYLTGSVFGRLATAFLNFTVSHTTLIVLVGTQTILAIYAACVARWQGFHTQSVVPVGVSIAVIGTFSFLHGVVVTEVFQTVRNDFPAVTWAGLFNQGGALVGAVIAFVLVSVKFYRHEASCDD